MSDFRAIDVLKFTSHLNSVRREVFVLSMFFQFRAHARVRAESEYDILFEYDGYWLMCSRRLRRECSDLLFLWRAQDRFGPWEPNSANPVKTDVRSSRPGGDPVCSIPIHYASPRRIFRTPSNNKRHFQRGGVESSRRFWRLN